jgi:hypothetical protein
LRPACVENARSCMPPSERIEQGSDRVCGNSVVQLKPRWVAHSAVDSMYQNPEAPPPAH